MAKTRISIRAGWKSLAAALLALCANTATAARPGVAVPADVWTALDSAPRVRIIVVFRVDAPETTLADPEGQAATWSASGAILAQLPAGEFELLRRYQSVNALALEVTAAGLSALARQSSIRAIGPDLVGSVQMVQTAPLTRISVLRNQGFKGQGVTVAILDSGVDTDHPDLSDDLVDQHCFCSGCCPGGGSTGVSAEDDNGHGTLVAGVITSRGSVATVGGAPDANIVAVKVGSAAGSVFMSDVIAGLDWVRINHPEARLVNLSLGTGTLYSGACDAQDATTMAFATAINSLRAAGVTSFVSSGNSGSGTQMSAPACIANAISVGAIYDANQGSSTFLGCTDATTAADKVTCYSNSNSTTDLFAPGHFVSTTILGGGATGTDIHSGFFGTSAAAPVAVACAADLLSARPSTTPAQLEAALESSLARVTDPTNGLNFPRVDCERALATLSPGGTIAVTRPTTADIVFRIGRKGKIRWTASGFTGTVKVELSRNGGTTWTPIKASTANDGALAWKVTGPATTQARIRVSSVSNPSVTDTSDVNFRIQ